jgi:hypothetical protein
MIPRRRAHQTQGGPEENRHESGSHTHRLRARRCRVDAIPQPGGPCRRRAAIAACDGWPNIHVEDAFTCDAATRALEGASRWLAQPKCQTLFLEFKDGRNLPLTAKLRELETDPEGYLRMVLFLDGAQSATCRRHGVLAFTAQGSRVVYLCGRDFERAWRRDVAEVQATVIHELLHSLGLGENPPFPRAITHRIQQLCW